MFNLPNKGQEERFTLNMKKKMLTGVSSYFSQMTVLKSERIEEGFQL